MEAFEQAKAELEKAQDDAKTAAALAEAKKK